MECDFKAQTTELVHVFDQILFSGIANIQALRVWRKAGCKFLDNSLLQFIMLARRKGEIFSVDLYRHFPHCPFGSIQLNKRTMCLLKCDEVVLPLCCSITLNQRQHFIGQTIAIVRIIGSLSVILNECSISEMVHCLFANSLTAVFCVYDVVIIAGKSNNIMNTNPRVCRFLPWHIFVNIGHCQ